MAEEKSECIKCGKESDNNLPMCSGCRTELADFLAFAKYVNSFEGEKEDLLWLIHSEISKKQSSIIGNPKAVKIVFDYSVGLISLIPIEPSGSTVNKKPQHWDRYLHIKEVIEQINKLYKASDIIEEQYVTP